MKQKPRAGKFASRFLALICLISPAAYADTVKMYITGGYFNYLGENVTPYAAHITPTNPSGTAYDTLVWCVDLLRTVGVGIGSERNYVVNMGAAITSGSFAGSTPPLHWQPAVHGETFPSNYQHAANLAAQSKAAPAGSAYRGKLAYTIWAIFDPDAVINHLKNTSAGQAVLTEIFGLGYSQANHGTGGATAGLNAGLIYKTFPKASFSVLTPYTVGSNGQYKYLNGQEFIVLTPEPAALALLIINIGGVFGLMALFRRRFSQN